MADVAARLGVSRQLVSLVLRDQPGASAESRERVLRAAEELGYSPNLGARNLRQSRSRHIGVAFVPTHASEPDIVEAIYPAAAEHGYQVVLSAQTRTRTTLQAVEELVSHRCAAIIVIGSELSAEGLTALAERVKVPMVAVGEAGRSPAYDVVRSDGASGIAALIDHLARLGHRRAAYVHAGAMPSSSDRLAGFLRAGSERGLETDVVPVPGPGYTEEAGAQAGRELLGRAELPTAVVTGNDQQAVGVLQVLARAGVAVPDEVSLTGFDDSRFAQLSSVDLTTARQDPGQMGAAAVAAAVRRMNRPTLEPSVSVVDPTLVVRSSTAPPAGS